MYTTGLVSFPIKDVTSIPTEWTPRMMKGGGKGKGKHGHGGGGKNDASSTTATFGTASSKPTSAASGKSAGRSDAKGKRKGGGSSPPPWHRANEKHGASLKIPWKIMFKLLT